ncbi:MAG TPA: winged helix-turn-helix domain-containing protein [Thermoplasmata archaeon]|nr:winged helix-turn-helix domain-containing protein [Thermoplasmata archaeon]
MGEDPLALETRRRVYDVVRRTPGLSAREIQRAAQTGWGETAYHLERLEDSHLLHRERGGHQDYFFTASVPLGDRTLLRLARSPSARRILVTLLDAPEITFVEVAHRTGLSPSRVSIHLRRWLETGIVESGRREALRIYRIPDRDRVMRLVIAYRSGYADGWVDRFIDSWAEMFAPG